MKRAALIGGALLAFAAAACLALLARDVNRWEGALVRDDVTLRTSPERTDLFEPDETLPGAARLVLGVDDDLAYRRALGLLALSVTPTAVTEDLDLGELRRAAEVALAEVAQGDPDHRRRSRATNLLGVLLVDRGGEVPGSVTGDRLESAIVSFEAAVLLDEQNDRAKQNLELALASRDPGTDETIPRSSGGKGALGRAGSGY
jgi:hypothetical protein